MAMHDLSDTAVMGSADASRTAPAVGDIAGSRRDGTLAPVAQAVSHLLSPPVMVIACVMITAGIDGRPDAWLAATAYALCGAVLPLALVVRLWRSGYISDVEITSRRQRFWPMLLTSTCAGIGAGMLQLAGAPAPVAGMASILAVQCLILMAVTTSWKISVHASAAATTSALLWQAGAHPLAALLPVVAVVWSRLHLSRHTSAQCVAGAALGAGLLLVFRPLLVG